MSAATAPRAGGKKKKRRPEMAPVRVLLRWEGARRWESHRGGVAPRQLRARGLGGRWGGGGWVGGQWVWAARGDATSPRPAATTTPLPRR